MYMSRATPRARKKTFSLSRDAAAPRLEPPRELAGVDEGAEEREEAARVYVLAALEDAVAEHVQLVVLGEVRELIRR